MSDSGTGDAALSLLRNKAAFTKAIASANKHAARTGGLSIVSRLNATMSSVGSTTTGGSFLLTARIDHRNITGKTLLSVAAVFSHYGVSAGTESQFPNDPTFKSALEPFGTVSDQTTNPPQRVFLNGAEIVTLSKRSVVRMDETTGYFAPNALFYERTAVTTAVTSGTFGRHQIARGGTTGYGNNTGAGTNGADSLLFGTVTGNTNAAFSCSLMLGRVADGTIAPSISINGDSIEVGAHGAVPGSGGWAGAACAAWPGGNFAIAGEKLSQAVVPANFLARGELSKYSTHILDGYGTNDLPAETLDAMKANTLALAFRAMSRGQNYIKSTLLPRTDSTNGWYDVAGQSQFAFEQKRQDYNSWLRDTSSSGFVSQAMVLVASIVNAGWAAIVETCGAIEVNAAGALTLNGGYWRAAQGGVLATGAVTGYSAPAVTASGAGFTVDAFRGKVLHITGGTGLTPGVINSQQLSSNGMTIGYHSATVLTLVNALAVAIDATSTFRIIDSLAVDGLHPSETGHVLIAAAVQPQVDTLMARA